MRYILTPYKEYFVNYYFQLSKNNNKIFIFSLQDNSGEYEASYSGILKLLHDKGDLAFKPSSGTHGIGFMKLSYRDGLYFVNNKYCHESDLYKIFSTIPSFYILTEYVTMHKTIKEIYPESANTIRIMVINENGISPLIASAYLRIGSSFTGVTDNVSFGGITASIDIETGKYYNGEQVINHVIKKCPYHPDTGVLIEGIIPNWDLVQKKILEISCFIPQLEYCGYDIVITENGFVILEINVHQDLHRFQLYSKKVQDYLFRKLEQKIIDNKRKYVRR